MFTSGASTTTTTLHTRTLALPVMLMLYATGCQSFSSTACFDDTYGLKQRCATPGKHHCQAATSCADGKSHGYCESHTHLMGQYCAKTCQLCPGDKKVTNRPTSPPTSTSRHSYTRISGRVIPGTADVMAARYGWTRKQCQAACDRTEACRSYMFAWNIQHRYLTQCELWSRAYGMRLSDWICIYPWRRGNSNCIVHKIVTGRYSTYFKNQGEPPSVCKALTRTSCAFFIHVVGDCLRCTLRSDNPLRGSGAAVGRPATRHGPASSGFDVH